MSQQLFSNEIYQKGIEYVQNNQVSPLKKKGNLYHAVVYGEPLGHVVIATGDNNKVIGISCNCKNGDKCEHAAAVYIKFQQEQGQDLLFQGDNLQELYERFKRTYRERPPSVANRKFLDKLESMINQLLYNDQCLPLSQVMLQLETMLSDIAMLRLDQKYDDDISFIFSSAFIKLDSQEKHFQDIFVDWLITIFTNTQLLHVSDMLFPILLNMPDTMAFSIYLQLINNQDIQKNSLLLEYIALYIIHSPQYNQETQKQLLEILKQYSQGELYTYLTIQQYIDNQNYSTAIQIYQDYIKTQEIHLLKVEFSQLLGILYFESEDIDNYQKYVLEYYKKIENQEDASYLQNLKKLYDKQWSIKKYNIYNQLNEVMNNQLFMNLLNKMNEWQWGLSILIDHPEFNLLDKYGDLIKENDYQNYLFIYQECIVYKLSFADSINEYKDIFYKMYEDLILKKSFIDMFMNVRHFYRNNDNLVKVFDYLYKEVIS